MQSHRVIDWVYRGMQLLYAATTVYIFLFGRQETFGSLLWGSVSAALFFACPAAERLFRLKLGRPLAVAVQGFIYLAFCLGTALSWYFRFPWYDNFIHLLSGILFSLIGLCFYARITGEGDRRHRPLLQGSYALFFSAFIAVVWECWEFFCFIALGNDAQQHLTTGVFDTMEDLIACMLGSALLLLDYCCYLRRGRSPLMALVAAFDRANNYPGAAA